MDNATTAPEEAGRVSVELWIQLDVYEAAMKRALLQGQTLASVARAALFQAAAEAVPIVGWVIAVTQHKKPRWEGTIFSTEQAARDAAAGIEYPTEVLSTDSDEARELGVGKIKPREYGEDRERIRFRVPKDQKTAAFKSIEAAGKSVPATVEDLLKIYVDKGVIINPNESE
jgi:hypothetical protein